MKQLGGVMTSVMYYKCFTIVIYDRNDSGQYYKTTITIVSDAPNCGVTYKRQSDDRNSFIIQATGIPF